MVVSIAAAWPADVRDTCGNVFGQSLRAYQPPIPANARVLEIGCAEFDWLQHAATAWPEMTFTGIDWRETKPKRGETRIQGDVMAAAFAPRSFDWIVAISTIEHIGLGHYKQDPIAEDGDTVAMMLAASWLAPGGWLYVDVPWNVGEHAYEVVRTSHRIYDDETIESRLTLLWAWTSRWSGVYGLNGEAVTEPQRLKGGESFYYRAYWLQKDG